MTQVADGATWKSMARRLYALVVGAVVVSFVLSIVGVQLLAPPPAPWLVRSAARQLERVLDDPEALAREVAQFKAETKHEIAVYDPEKRLLASSTSTTDAAPALPADLDAFLHDPMMGAGGPLPGGPSAGEPAFARGPGSGFGAKDGPKKPMGPPFPRGKQAFVMPLSSSSGAVYAAVIERPADWPALAFLLTSVLLALFAISVTFARILSRPLAELVRAADAFGRGDLETRVDTQKAGAFSALARAFNEMAARVVTARRAERDLLANVSHELRTPLSRIRVALELAAEGDAETARASLAEIGTDLAEVETMIKDIFTAARLEGGNTVAPLLRLEAGAIEPLLAAAAHRFRIAYPKHTLRVDTSGAGDVAVTHDATLFRRAIDNLLDNAGKYSEPASIVELECSTERSGDADELVIRVRDHGTGIALDDQAQLFTPFFRADKSRTRDSGGVGLGLVLVKRIVEAHGGTVAIASAPGAGTTATVRLSLA